MPRPKIQNGCCGKLTIAFFLLLMLTSCTFNFELTSQRTALENQVMGTYKELDDDLVLVSSVRGPGSKGKSDISDHKRKALLAKQNQNFNRDDIDELKERGILGESNKGTIALLPGDIGKAEKASKDELKLTKVLIEEENRDRRVLWKQIISANENLSAKDLLAVQKTEAKRRREAAADGHWYQDDKGRWKTKQPAQKKEVEGSTK